MAPPGPRRPGQHHWPFNLDRQLTSASSSVGTYTFTYDAAGRVKTVDAPFGISFTFGYDASGALRAR